MKTKNSKLKIVALIVMVFANAFFLNAQTNWLTVGNPVTGGGNKLGPLTAGIPLNIYSGGTQRAIFNGTTGFFGVGLLAPAFPLDVQDRINITNNNALGFGYFINGFDVLQVPGVENTFVGKGSGANSNMTPPFPFVQANTFVGFQAGGSTVNGDRNTFVGRAAGYANVNGRFNTFIGCDAGLNLATGDANTFVGEHAGWRMINFPKLFVC